MPKDYEILNINTQKSYKYILGKHLLKDTGCFCKTLDSNCKICIVSDTTVSHLYEKEVSDSLKYENYEVHTITLPEGEKNKSLETSSKILNFLHENNFTRKDILIALGGGLVGDITGFVASIYMRGLKYIQIPTTFLSALDSSVGGKTGLNFKNSKNLIGTFHQPSLVVCSIDTFKTLNDERIRDGLAEAIKMALIQDKTLFDFLLEISKNNTYTKSQDTMQDSINKNQYFLSIHIDDFKYIIKSCLSIKSNIVKQDEFDSDIRQMLNLGHTLGHCIESASSFKISHGSAVASGMLMELQGIYKMNQVKNNLLNQLKRLLYDLGFDVNLPLLAKNKFLSNSDIYNYIFSDKKISNDKIFLTKVENIGSGYLFPIDTKDFKQFIEYSFDVFDK